MPIRQLAAKMSPRGWAMVGGSAAVAIVFMYLVFSLASKPSYSTLLTGLDPAQTGKITSTLDNKGINYQIQNNGTALGVQSDQTGQARIALATAGLLSTASSPGFELFDKSQLGASNFQQQITYQRALEGQLDQTIDGIQGVSSAQVQLVLPNPQDQLFADNTTPATAAVEVSATSLDPSSVRGIAQLVASSVPNLDVNKVTVVDASSGQQLWPANNGIGADGSPSSTQAANAQYDSATAAEVTALLAQTLGPGKAQVQVNAQLNSDQTTSDSLVYGMKGVPLTQQTQTEILAGTAAKPAGRAGTAAIAGYAQTGTTGNSNYRNITNSTNYGVDKTVTHSVIAPGAVTRQAVSVLVDTSVPATELPAIKSAVAAAVGLNAKRGDVLSLSQVAFVKPKVTAPAAGPAKMINYAKYAIIGIGALLFLFFVGRMLRRREREGFSGEATWIRELSSPRSLAELERVEMLPSAEPTRVARLQAPVNVAKRQVEDLVERDADRVAQQVRAWMAED